jgi:D-alanyl-D-alanine dipeptidase
MSTIDDAERREYWTKMMDEADEFMQQITLYPVQECMEPMVSLRDAVESAGIEVVFSDKPHVHGLPRQYFMRAGLVPQYLAVTKEMNGQGWMLKMEDCYRTAEMQTLGLQEHIFNFILKKVQWESGQDTPPMDLLYRRLGSLIALTPKVGTHMSGSAMDVSVLLRDTGEEVDRGRPYLEMSELTPMGTPFISEQAQQNRRDITALMQQHGFMAYPWEFWHYNDGDAYAELLNKTGKPAKYGPVKMDPSNGTVTPIENPTTPITDPEVIRELMEKVLANK